MSLLLGFIKTSLVSLLKRLRSIFCFISSYFTFVIWGDNSFEKRVLILVCGLFLCVSSYKIFDSDIISDSQAQTDCEVSVAAYGLTLPNCANLAESTVPDPGNNCLYYNLPLCKDLNSLANCGSVSQEHRINCADLIDLPLCSQIEVGNGVSAKPGRNCVELCSDPAYDNPDPGASPPLVRAEDFAIFNRDCMRFCDNVETGVTAIPSGSNQNCVQRFCHQLPDGTDPVPGTNCELLKCNLLTPHELNKAKFSDATKQYCDGSNLKCYKFSQAQLPFVFVRTENPLCQIHDCKPEVSSCGADDTLNVTKQGQLYTDSYEQYINAGYSISSSVACNRIECRPVVRLQYRCVGDAGVITGSDVEDVNRNPSCDATGDGAVCNSNYCFETVDCNLSANSARPECLEGVAEDPPGGFVDPYNSWFYRPKPLFKATHTSTGVLRAMEDRLCYTRAQMEKDEQNRDLWGNRREQSFLLFTIDFGWFHDYLAMDTRSPGWCGAPRHGNRGTGYSYLCGTGGSLYNRPSDYVSYYAGYVRTSFSNNSARHVIRVCTRFKNTITLNACGKRECGITAGFVDGDFGSGVRGQTCGGDVCKDYEVVEAEPRKCMMTDGMAQGDRSSECSKKTDINVRNRVVQYGDRVCAFIDSKNQFAYNGMFMKGHESLEDGVTCINDPDGDPGSDEGCQGYDSNSYEGLADKWRALMKVPYIQNNRPSGEGYTDHNGKFVQLKGYLDRNGRLFKEQECPKITLRIPPPDLYNLANVSNSDRLFLPPLYIRSAVKIKGGSDSSPSEGEDFGKTDFHFPEMKIQYGTIISRMSLSMDEISGDEGDQGSVVVDSNSPAYQTLTITVRDRNYDAEVYVQKEFSSFSNVPLFCLYRRIKNRDGTFVAPFRVGCVERKLPEIDNRAERLALPNTPPRKVLTSLKAGSTHNDSEIEFRYLTGFGSNNVEDSRVVRLFGPNTEPNGLDCSGDDICSQKVSVGNSDVSAPTCTRNPEDYLVCAKREECSQIFVECAQNEIDYGNAVSQGLNTRDYEIKRRDCNNRIVPFCINKSGYASSDSASVYDLNPDDAYVDPKIYGWFNEICLVTGFENKLKNVVAHSLLDGVQGKCIIDPLSPYLTDNDPNTNCDGGGFAPHCLCVVAPDGFISGPGQMVRKQTPREAGLCVDMPIPQLCPAIDYNLFPNPFNSFDPDYSEASLNRNVYNDLTGVHLSHKYRSEGKPSPDPIPLAGHAEFPPTFLGVNSVRGECKGYWTYQRNVLGVELYPEMDCLVGPNQSAIWDISNLKNPCVRYSCPAVQTTGPDRIGKYQNNYDGTEIGENKGLSHGFAMWPSHTKTNDFLENVTASSCIWGFKPNGSSPVLNNGEITGYSGGNLPTRDCNQLGVWRSTSNNCLRIQCPQVNPPIPTSEADLAAWNQWFDSGGATFPAVNASRSPVRIQDESISYGSCNNDLGFYQAPGAPPPSRKCDELGNWLPVENECVSTCDAILTDEQGSSLNNGFAKWKEAAGSLSANGNEGEFIGCVSGYVTNPYPPEFDVNGNRLSNADDLNRPAEDPRRLCKAGRTSQGVDVSVWTATINSCINKCPGANYDARIGVGRTVHPGLDGPITIDWPDGQFGQFTYMTNWNGEEEHLSAAEFQQNRTNRFYLVKRYCDYNGKWQDPIPSCSANNGRLGNATYLKNDAAPGYANSIPLLTLDQDLASDKVTGTCVAGYSMAGGRAPTPAEMNDCLNTGNSFLECEERFTSVPAAPVRKCLPYGGGGEIDRVFLGIVGGTRDCELISCDPISISAVPGTSQDRIDLISQNRQYLPGEIVLGSCVNDPNRAIYTSLHGGRPQAVCQDDGTWQYSNLQNCKKPCIIGGRQVRVNAKDCGNGEVFGFNNFFMQHGEVFEFNATSVCGSGTDDCDAWAFAATCNDGQSIVLSRYVHGGELPGTGSQSGHQCPYAKFNGVNGWQALRSSVYRDQTIRFPFHSNGDVVKDRRGIPVRVPVTCRRDCEGRNATYTRILLGPGSISEHAY